jgi:hypothetical protein
MGMFRSLISRCFLGLFLVVGFTVPLGQRTLFGHVSNIWSADETQELVDGVKDSSGPLVDRVKRGVEAGLADEDEAGPGDAVPGDAVPAEDAPKSEKL